ncbi:MAG: hypothetical protein MI746_06595 [Pseudomonadales bacterium]|nr:hypothetical protein [Pseudomonadales bacterium]
MARSAINNGLLAGILYAVGVFAIGFMLGVVRVALLVPLLGESLAVIIELPVILAASWVLCGRAIHIKQVTPEVSARAAMSLAAFVVIMVGDLMVGLFIFGLSTDDYVARYSEFANMLGLAGQMLFAIFPLLRHRQGIAD